MKNILVPTDFSDCAANALHVAVLLARKTGAKVHVYNRMPLPYNWERLTRLDQAKDREALQQIQNTKILLKTLTGNPDYKDVSFHTAYSGGYLIEAIRNYVDTRDIDLIIMGSHGVSGLDEQIIGSNTQKVVRQVNCPVMVIKEPVNHIDFKNIVFASNFDNEDIQPFTKFTTIARLFDATIHLVAVKPTAIFHEPDVLYMNAMEEYAEIAKPLICKSHIHADFWVESGIRNFANEVQADMIAISNKNKHPLRRIFQGSKVEALVNHSNLPVLSIDYK